MTGQPILIPNSGSNRETSGLMPMKRTGDLTKFVKKSYRFSIFGNPLAQARIASQSWKSCEGMEPISPKPCQKLSFFVSMVPEKRTVETGTMGAIALFTFVIT